MILDTVDEKKKGVHTRYLILLIIFIVTAVNYADRATLSIAGTEVAKELQLSAVSMGYIFSAFGWAYLLMQIPGGWLLDRFGSKKIYALSIFTWSLFTVLQGFVGVFGMSTTVVARVVMFDPVPVTSPTVTTSPTRTGRSNSRINPETKLAKISCRPKPRPTVNAAAIHCRFDQRTPSSPSVRTTPTTAIA